MKLLHFNLPDTSSRIMALGLTQPVAEMSTRRVFWEIESGRRVTLTSPPSVNPLSRQCEILNISQPYRLPRPDTGIVLLIIIIIHFYTKKNKNKQNPSVKSYLCLNLSLRR
jgi:hypothetical protein